MVAVESWAVVDLHIALLVEEAGVDLLEMVEVGLLAWAVRLHKVVSVVVADLAGSLHLPVEIHLRQIAAVVLAVDLDSSWPQVEVERILVVPTIVPWFPY